MKIGVVCEGVTDFHAISSFLGKSLEAAGINAAFVAIQPEIDKTQPNAGWGNVFYWFERNPWEGRVQRYFGGGLFGGDLGEEPYNCILIHLDSDILGEAGFGSYVSSHYGHLVCAPTQPSTRAAELRTIIGLAANFKSMTAGDIERHVMAPAVESTEAWCIAAFQANSEDCEQYTGQKLIDSFMSALEMSELRLPNPPYAKINKDTKRRKRFCEKHAPGYDRIYKSCEQYRTILSELLLHSLPLTTP